MIVFSHLVTVGIPLIFAITYTLAFTDTMGDADVTRCLVKKGENAPFPYDPTGSLEKLYKTDQAKW